MILDVVGSNPITHPIFPAPALQAPFFRAALTGETGIKFYNECQENRAKVAELVDAPDLGSGILTM